MVNSIFAGKRDLGVELLLLFIYRIISQSLYFYFILARITEIILNLYQLNLNCSALTHILYVLTMNGVLGVGNVVLNKTSLRMIGLDVEPDGLVSIFCSFVNSVKCWAKHGLT